jgi:hypothetical protein
MSDRDMKTREMIAKELQDVERGYGSVSPEAVVEYAAKNKGSTLYSQFEWDDGEAAHNYRLGQARSIIRVHVSLYTPEESSRPILVSAYVSLSDHRGEGYESLSEVMTRPRRREVLLVDTINRLASIQETALFKELRPLHQMIDKLVEKFVLKEKEVVKKNGKAGRSSRVRSSPGASRPERRV